MAHSVSTVIPRSKYIKYSLDLSILQGNALVSFLLSESSQISPNLVLDHSSTMCSCMTYFVMGRYLPANKTTLNELKTRMLNENSCAKYSVEVLAGMGLARNYGARVENHASEILTKSFRDFVYLSA